jgi:hypothetical protein
MKTGLFAIALVFSVFATAGFTASGVDRSTPDPVIAAAGDIACSATDPDFNERQGSPDFCAQGRTSDLLVEGDYDAILASGIFNTEVRRCRSSLQAMPLHGVA